MSQQNMYKELRGSDSQKDKFAVRNWKSEEIPYFELQKQSCKKSFLQNIVMNNKVKNVQMQQFISSSLVSHNF